MNADVLFQPKPGYIIRTVPWENGMKSKHKAHILAMTVRLHLPNSHSLKERRSIVRSLVKRLRNKFETAVSETGGQDTWQIAEITLALVSTDLKFLENIKTKIIVWIENETLCRAVITNVQSEFLK